MATILIPSGQAGRIRARVRSGLDRSGVAGGLRFLGAVLASLFAAELVLPEADPDQVRARLIELRLLDAAAAPQEQRTVLRHFQVSAGVEPHGVADGRTVSALMRSVREERELREVGLGGLAASGGGRG